jgi:rare lipoprotein A (peptidoglycan hydrolase)
MATVVATIAVALAPMIDALDDLHVKPRPYHHHRIHRSPPAFSSALASYYSYPAGAATACGFDATYGVASRTLPCGTRVRFCAQRCVVGVVDDRGPYIYSRLWDLSIALAHAIGFDMSAGVGPVRWALV